MAKIYMMPNQKQWDEMNTLKDFAARDAAEKKLFDAIPKDKIIGFGVADGSALYYVQSLKPLVICHIPYGDAYRAHRLIENGLNVSEVKKLLPKKGGR